MTPKERVMQVLAQWVKEKMGVDVSIKALSSIADQIMEIKDGKGN